MLSSHSLNIIVLSYQSQVMLKIWESHPSLNIGSLRSLLQGKRDRNRGSLCQKNASCYRMGKADPQVEGKLRHCTILQPISSFKPCLCFQDRTGEKFSFTYQRLNIFPVHKFYQNAVHKILSYIGLTVYKWVLQYWHLPE